jgi:hypothetical protein
MVRLDIVIAGDGPLEQEVFALELSAVKAAVDGAQQKSDAPPRSAPIAVSRSANAVIRITSW